MEKYIPGFQRTSDWTWHHFDDLVIDSNGDAWCTMQLADRQAHAASGMTHSGSVAQLDKYYLKVND